MKNRNIGTVERWTRAIVGLILLSLIYFLDSGWRWVGLIGIVPLATAAIGWCPMYALFGISTCKVEARDRIPLKRSMEHGRQR